MDRIRGMRTTASASRWVRGGAAVVCGALLTACAASGESDGASGATAPAPASSPPPAAAPPSAAPAGGDRLDGRGPVLDVKNAEYRHSVRIVDAVTSPNTPEDPAPSGLTYVQLVLKLTGEPGRALKSPHPAHWVVEFDGCRAAAAKNSKVGCAQMDGGSRYFGREDMLSDEFGPGVNSWFGTLEADTPYWIRAWQLVPEGVDLSRARLCEARPAAGTENCVPVGEVRSGDAALPGAGQG
ncbi:hypothetical protein ACFYUL_27870 [Streptomyces sp. NPDC004311]|uniref:hypothetical protein n=1 Tax=Streptomyces sp. NPDC004311 TaxID=3364698 RepID=UPI0036C6E24B